jgi:hypothetical protein
MNPNTEYMKVLADGTRVPATDPRTDHVAVLDTTLQLLIYPHSVGVDGKRAKQAQLKDAVAKLDVLGGGWRLAERHEAESIIDLTRHDPAVNPSLFPGIKSAGHITATAAAWAPARAAWWVGLSGGGVYGHLLNYDGLALAVRPVGQ